MVGKSLGNIQPMCSAPGAFPPGFFFRKKSAPFHKKCIFVCFYDKTSFFIIKRPDPGGFARLGSGASLVVKMMEPGNQFGFPACNCCSVADGFQTGSENIPN